VGVVVTTAVDGNWLLRLFPQLEQYCALTYFSRSALTQSQRTSISGPPGAESPPTSPHRDGRDPAGCAGASGGPRNGDPQSAS
jgi:hypothetical protein